MLFSGRRGAPFGRLSSRRRACVVGLAALVSATSFSLAACGGASGSGAASAAKASQEALDREVAEAAAAQGGLASASGGARGESGLNGASLKADLLGAGDKVKLDGVLGEWPARAPARLRIEGAADASETFAGAVRYDADSLYVGGEVTSATFRRTARFADDEDHASLLLAFGTGAASVATYEVLFFAGKPGETSGQVRFGADGRGGRGAVPGAKIVEAPAAGGYSFEASIPWSAFPEASTVRVGLRAALRYAFHEGGGSSVRVVATSPGDARHPEALATLPTEPEQALEDGFLAEHNLRGSDPSFDLLADVTGNAMKERIQVWGSTLTICGPGYRDGKDYYFRDLGAPVVRLEARAVTGRAKQDLVLTRRVTDGDGHRDWFEVLTFLDKDEPDKTFGQEVAVVRGARHVDDTVHAVRGEIDVSVLPAVGWDASSYEEAMTTDVTPILLPWGTVKSRTYRFKGGRFVVDHEVAQAGAAASRARVVPPEARLARDPAASLATVAPAAPSVDNAPAPDAAAIVQRARQDLGLGAAGAPRFSLAADLDGDGKPETVTLIDRTLVVTGPSIGGGRGYCSLTLQSFGSDSDIHEVIARDLVGEGHAQLVLRGTRQIAPARGESVDEDLLFVYALKSGALAQVFAIETARTQQGKRVQGLVQFVPARSGHGLDVDVRPGRADGWSRTTYPWPQDRPGVGSLEPLLLPWGAIPSVRYAWDGTKFAPR